MKLLKLGLLVGIGGIAAAPLWALSGDLPVSNDVRTISSADPTNPAVQQTVVTGRALMTDDVLSFVKLQDQRGREHTFYVESTTPIYDQFHRIVSVSDIQPGNLLSVQFDPANDRVAEMHRIGG